MPPSDAPPIFIAPQLSKLVDATPDDDGWLHEIKLDGYRLDADRSEATKGALTAGW
jgi:bifunctional non-homologous end joining protein LigD